MILPDALALANTRYPQRVDITTIPARCQPPFSITGVRCTPNRKSRALVDWIALTAEEGTTVADLIPRSERLEWNAIDRGIHGYRQQMRSGAIALYSNGNPGMGVHLVISGEGCRQMEANGSVDEDYIGGWSGLLKHWLDMSVKFTRIDIALDDFDDVLNITELQASIQQGDIVSRARQAKYYLDTNMAGEKTGEGISIGSRTSESYYRIYDKALEQIARNLGEKEDGNWVRVEVEFKQNKAQTIAERIAEGAAIGPLLQGILRADVQFKAHKDSDSNKRRWPLLPQWDTFLNNVGGIQLVQEPKKRTLEDVDQWLVKQVAPSLALIVKAAGGDLDRLNIYVAYGSGRLSKRHLAMLG